MFSVKNPKVNRIMAKILQIFISAASKELLKELLKVLISAFEAITAFFTFKINKHKEEQFKEETKQKQEFDKKVDDAVDKGSIEDLLDLRR